MLIKSWSTPCYNALAFAYISLKGSSVYLALTPIHELGARNSCETEQLQRVHFQHGEFNHLNYILTSNNFTYTNLTLKYLLKKVLSPIPVFQAFDTNGLILLAQRE